MFTLIVEAETLSVDVKLLPCDSEQHKMAFTSLLNLFPEKNIKIVKGLNYTKIEDFYFSIEIQMGR